MSRNLIYFYFQQVIYLFHNRPYTTIILTTKISAGWLGSGWCLNTSMTMERNAVRFSYPQLTQWRQLGCLNWWMRYELQLADAVVERQGEAAFCWRVFWPLSVRGWSLRSSGMWRRIIGLLVLRHFDTAGWRHGQRLKCQGLSWTRYHIPDERRPQPVI